MGIEEKGASNVIIFNASKKETFNINSGFKTLNRKLRTTWKVIVNKEEIIDERLAGARLFVIAAPREKFSAAEFVSIKKYVEGGGSLLVLLSEGGESKLSTNINFFLEEYGIMVNNDCVVRTHYYKYFHPKEALVSNGVLNRALSQAAGKHVAVGEDDSNNSQALTFLYPFGATLNVMKPSMAVLSSGSVSFPLNRPVGAFFPGTRSGKGKIAVLGSAHMFSDQYLDKEENTKILDVIINYLTSDDIKMNVIDAEDPEVADYNMQPDTSQLADQVKSCLQESDEVPRDITRLFDSALYTIDTSTVPKVIKAYGQLNMKHETLGLINPEFETPLPPLQPAVFPPQFRELPAPSLDLFDLDEQFSSEKGRLAQITNKCTDTDLEYYIRECGDILAINNKIPIDKRDAKHILEYVLHQVVEFKKLNQEDEDQPYQSGGQSVRFGDEDGF